MSSEATITAGDLRVSTVSSPTWLDITDEANPKSIQDLSSYFMVPGDTIKLSQELNVIVVGDNISGILEVNVPNATLSDPMLSQGTFVLSLLDKDGVEIGTATAPVNTANSIALEVDQLFPTAPSGEKYTVELKVALPAAADNATKVQVSSLEDMQIILKQGGPSVSPIEFLSDSNLGSYLLTAEPLSIPLVAMSAKDPVTVSVASGAIPPGMSLVNGKLEGVPGSIGTFNFTIHAENSKNSGDRSFTMTTVLTEAVGWQSVSVGDSPMKFLNTAISTDGNTITAVSQDRIYRSTNGGVTWTDLGARLGKVVVSSTGETIYDYGRPAYAYRNGNLVNLPGSGAPTTVSLAAISDSNVVLALSFSAIKTSSPSSNSWGQMTTYSGTPSSMDTAGSFTVLATSARMRFGVGSSDGGITLPAGVGSNPIITVNTAGKFVVTGSTGEIHYGEVVKPPSYSSHIMRMTGSAPGNGAAWQDMQLVGNSTLVGLQDGRVKKSTDLGVTWTDITPVNMPVKAMQVPSSIEDRIILTIDGGEHDFILHGRI